jgi:hypothetical protein
VPEGECTRYPCLCCNPIAFASSSTLGGRVRYYTLLGAGKECQVGTGVVQSLPAYFGCASVTLPCLLRSQGGCTPTVWPHTALRMHVLHCTCGTACLCLYHNFMGVLGTLPLPMPSIPRGRWGWGATVLNWAMQSWNLCGRTIVPVECCASVAVIPCLRTVLSAPPNPRYYRQASPPMLALLSSCSASLTLAHPPPHAQTRRLRLRTVLASNTPSFTA